MTTNQELFYEIDTDQVKQKIIHEIGTFIMKTINCISVTKVKGKYDSGEEFRNISINIHFDIQSIYRIGEVMEAVKEATNLEVKIGTFGEGKVKGHKKPYRILTLDLPF